MSITTAPTLSEARAAADAMVQAGATKVILFGSAAQGDANPLSDLDFLVVVDDLGDYSGRWSTASHMWRAAKAVLLQRHCDILVTDRPELKHLIANVSTSFEATMATNGIVLADIGPQQDINWKKKLVAPMNDTEQAESTLKDALVQLGHLHETAKDPSEWEIEAWESGDVAEYQEQRDNRIRAVLGCGHLCFELSLKTLIHILSKGFPPYKHSTADLISILPESTQREIREFMGTLQHMDVDHWHISRNYGAARLPEGAQPATEELAVQLTNVACRVLDYAAGVLEQHGGNPELVMKAKRLGPRVAERLNTRGVEPDLTDVSPPATKQQSTASPDTAERRRSLWQRLFGRR